jgi:hypothetical protein
MRNLRESTPSHLSEKMSEVQAFVLSGLHGA